jgi:hypothetical protein
MLPTAPLSSAACAAAIAQVEPGSGLPPGLLGAIARVESGRRAPEGAAIVAWPWTADIEGSGAFFNGKAQAIAAVQAAQRDGARSIDVGCMQVNLQQHPQAFASLEQAFDPLGNVAYAARLLRTLHDQAGTWPRAAALYHSATPAIGAEYERKVMAAWSGTAAAYAALAPVFRPTAGGPGGMAGSPFGTTGLAAMRGAPIQPAAARTPYAGMGGGAGRGLAAYRAMPIRIAGPLRLRH